MDETYFESVPSDILHLLLNKFFGDTIVYSLINVLKLDESRAFRSLCIEAAPMLSRFSHDFSFRFRRISWLHIYEGLVATVNMNGGKLPNYPLFDRHFRYDQRFNNYKYDGMLAVPRICDDFLILILYQYSAALLSEYSDALLSEYSATVLPEEFVQKTMSFLFMSVF